MSEVPGWYKLFTWLPLLTGTDEKRVADVTPVPPGEGPICHNFRIYNYLDVHIKEGDELELLEFIVADLAQLGVALRGSDICNRSSHIL